MLAFVIKNVCYIDVFLKLHDNMASAYASECFILTEKAELLTRIFLAFDDKKQIFPWSDDIEALKELCRQDIS